MKKYHTILFVTILTLFTSAYSQSIDEVNKKIALLEKVSVELADKQLLAYNNKDIDEFLRPFSDSVKVREYPNTMLYVGKSEMRKRYEKLFAIHPKLKCEIANRIVFGNKVIDLEKLTGFDKSGGFPDNWVMDALVVYTITNDLISEVCFVKQL
jgi:hypothetical protein